MNQSRGNRTGSARPTVLWVTNEPPSRNGTGGQLRQANLLDALVGRADVHLLVAGEVEDTHVRASVTSLTEVPVPPMPPPSSLWQRRRGDLFDALVGRWPPEIREARVARLEVLRALRVRAFPETDVVLVEHTGLAPILPAGRTMPWALTLHNVASTTAKQMADLAAGRRQRWLFEQDRRKAAAFERWALEAYDLVFSASDDDAASLDGHSVVVPNGVDLSRFRSTSLSASKSIVFSGHLAYLPNVDGLMWFCKEVLPLVCDRVPDARFHIVGRDPVAEVRGLVGPGVELHADVSSTVPYLDAARLAVVPLRMGSGTRLKAFEAAGAGRPVVGTTIGLAGVPWVDGVNALIADDARSFAEAVSLVLEDDATARSLASAGRCLAEQFDWHVIGEGFCEALLSLAERGRRSA